MSPESDQSDEFTAQRTFTLTLAAVVGQVGCLTTVVILAALFGGMWLDGQFGTKPMFTVGLTIISVPVTLVAMIWIVRIATNRLATPSKKATPQDKENYISG